MAWGRAYSVLWAGGGIRAGLVHGATDRQAANVIQGKETPDDVSATLYKALGIAHDTLLQDIAERQRRISEGHRLRHCWSEFSRCGTLRDWEAG